MQETERVADGFVPRFGIRIGIDCFCIEKVAKFGQVDDFHRAMLQEIVY
jgi:hypothetical protein